MSTNPKLPLEAFVHVETREPSQSVALVCQGEAGYFPVESRFTRDLATHEEAKNLVLSLNTARGVTPIQAECMQVGSMFGWAAPGADPDTALKPK